MKATLHTIFLIGLGLVIHSSVFGQEQDSTYTKEYPQKYRVMPHLSYSTVQARDGGVTYSPNSPMAVGFGVAIKNTFLDFKFGYGFIPLTSSDYGKTKTLDLQLHNYNKEWLFDFFYQNYKGFFGEAPEGLTLYKNMQLYQLGLETTYIVNNDKFSAEAAFEQSVIQLKSAGSIVVGGGAYGYRIRPAELATDTVGQTFIDNAQLGINAGYAYSWVLNPQWMMSAMATLGANFGNELNNLENFNLKVYPTVFSRYSLAYHKDDYAIALILLAHIKSIYPREFDNINVTTIRLELCYVKHFDQFFGKEK